ncbi:MAG TPA: hypothetical protein VMI75_10300, partial [Polyangiaceae bacterium]|nr:hypothetical protein [Polyangiaceae bacterium]
CAGDCAGVPSSSEAVVLVGEGGEIDLPAASTCTTGPAASQSGCTSHVDETCVSAPCTTTVHGDMVFAADGSSASGDGTEILTCGGSVATLTVAIAYTRQ